VRDSIDLTQSAIGQLGWNAQGDLILSSTDGSLRIWNAESKTTLSLLEEHPHQADGVTVLPDGKTLAVTSGYRLDIWDIPTNSRRKIIPNTEHLNDPAISPDGTTLAVCSNGDGLWLIDTQNWERRDVMIPGEVPWRLAWSPDGKMLGAVSADDILLWDMPSRNLLGQLSPSAYSLESFMDFSFSPDSRYLAAKFNPSAQDSDQLWVFDATTRQSVTILDASVPGQWSQDGKRILSANRDGLLWLDPFGGTPASLLPLEDIRVQQLRFSPDYSMIAMAYANSPEDLGIISLADPTDGRILHTFHGHRADISDLRFLPDGRTLAAVSWDGVVILWDVSPYLQ
jgi:WD40 repeat protein